MNKIEYTKAIELLKNIVQDCKFKEKIYLVGGCVRDLELGLTPKDIDLCIDYPEGTNLFMEFLKTRSECSGFVVYNRFKTGKFVLDLGDSKIDIECVVPRVETYNNGPRKPDNVQQTTISEDAVRRDFCCNALYMNLLSGKILDPTGQGIQDCKEKILRTPLDPKKTYIDDPLRMLRAIRFFCTKEFSIETKTYSNITDYPEYYSLSKERIRDEFTKILMSKKAVQGIRALVSKGLMKNIILKFQEYYTFNQNNKHHDKTWAEHSFAVLDYVIKNNRNASLELRLAALLHDVSKPTCYQIKDDGTFSYHGHEMESAKEARDILIDLKYSGEIINKVVFLIENHMCIKQLYNYDTHEYTGKPKKTRQLIRHLGENLYDEMRLIDADNMCHKPCWNMLGQVESFLRETERIKNLQPIPNFTVPVSGEEIMKFFEIESGKLVRDIKQIFQDYYDEDPELNEYGLFCKYISEFGPVQPDKNHTLWIVKRDYLDNCYSCYSSQPSRLKDYWICDDIPLKITNLEELYNNIPKVGEVIQIQGGMLPRVWRKKQRQLKAREKMKDLEEAAIKLYQEFPEFESLEFRLDNGPDLYAKVKWNDNTFEEWI